MDVLATTSHISPTYLYTSLHVRMQHKLFYWLLYISKQASVHDPETGLSSSS